MKTSTFLGMPMNWDAKRIFENVWNPDDRRLFPPKRFGIGWDVNLHAVLRLAGLTRARAYPKVSGRKLKFDRID